MLCLLVGSGKGVSARQTVPLLQRPGVVDDLQANEGSVCEVQGNGAEHYLWTHYPKRQFGLQENVSGCSSFSS